MSRKFLKFQVSKHGQLSRISLSSYLNHELSVSANNGAMRLGSRDYQVPRVVVVKKNHVVSLSQVLKTTVKIDEPTYATRATLLTLTCLFTEPETWLISEKNNE